MSSRVTSNFSTHDGKWLYTVAVDGVEVSSGETTSYEVMRTHMDDAIAAARRNLETAEAAERFKQERRLAVLLVAPTIEVATAAAELVRLLLKLPAHVEVTPMGVFGEVPEGLRVVGFCALGVDWSGSDVAWWVKDRVLAQMSRGAVFMGLESNIDDLVSAGAKRVYPFPGQ